VAKLATQNAYMVSNPLGKAQCEMAMGNATQVADIVNQAYDLSIKINKEFPLDHAQTCIEISEIWFEYGHMLKSMKYLEEAKKINDEVSEPNEAIAATIDVDLARISTARGFYGTSLEFLDRRMDYYLQRAVKKETIVDQSSGTIETVKLQKEEWLPRLRNMADILTLKAVTLNRMGRFISSDSAFQYADKWIDQNLGKGDIKYLENLYFWAEMLEDNGVADLPIKYYEKVNMNIVRQSKPTHLLNTKTMHRLIRAYQRENDQAKMKRYISAFDGLTKKYFGKRNIHYMRYDALELDVRLAANKTKKLEEKATKMLAVRSTLPDDHPLRIEINEFLFANRLVNEDFNGAEQALQEIVSIKEKIYGDRSPELAYSKIKQGSFLFRFKDDLEGAQKIFDEYFFGIVESETTPGHKDYLNIVNDIAELYVIQDRYSEASDLLDKALLAARRKYDNRDVLYAEELRNIASLQLNIGEYDKAETNIEEAVDIYEDVKDRDRVVKWAEAHETRARLYAIQALYDEAEDELNEAQKLLGKADLLTSSARPSSPIEEIASLYIDIGQYSDTKELLDEGIPETEARFGSNSRKLIKLLSEQSRLFLIVGDYTDAEKVARRSVRIAESVYGKNSTKTADVLYQLAAVYTAIGEYEKAEENINQVVEVRKSQFGEKHVDYAKALTQLALIKYYKKDPPQKIEPLLLDAKEIISTKLGYQSPILAETLKNLAALYIREGRTDEAFNLLDQSQRIWEERLGRRNNINLAGIFVLKGDLYYFQFNYEKAQDLYNDARKVYKKVFNETHPDYVKVLSKMSKVSYMRGNKRESKKLIDEALLNYNNFIKEFFPALSEREKAKFWSTIRGDFEFYNTLAFELYKNDDKIVENVYNNAITTKALLLNSSIKMRRSIINSNKALVVMALL
jgi:tetratricopeptide (TPR) repeat protein